VTAGPAYRRILAGDGKTLDSVIAALGGKDRQAISRWRHLLRELFDTIRVLAIYAGYVDPPRARPFWAAMPVERARDVMNALGSLGYRIDSQGAWQDDRVPSRRDVSVALLIAGVDAIRLRLWPSPEELAALAGETVVAAADYLADLSPDLELAEVSAAVDSAAHDQDLGELWRAWDRVRPLLLA
jgi:hypothetical protein